MIRTVPEGLWLEFPAAPVPPGDPRHGVFQALDAGDDRVVPHDGGVLVEAERLRAWSDAELRGLGVEWFGGAVTVEERGIPGSRYRWELSWEGGPGDVVGTWLVRGGRPLLLDAPLAEVARLAQEVVDRPRTHVFATIARLGRLARDPRVQPTRRLRTRQIQQADGVRLAVDRAEDGTVTISPSLVDLATGAEVDLDPATLLRASEQCLGNDDVVPLGSDRWLVLDAGAARNARLALAAPTADPETRARFVENPLAFLPDGDAFDDADYSARVVGVGEVKRALAAAPPTHRDWADTDGALVLQSAAGEVAVPLAELGALREAVAAAVSRGEDRARWAGHEVPATAATLEAIDRVLSEPHGPPAEGEPPPPPRVLLIAENEVVLGWAPPTDARRPVRSPELPPLRAALQAHQLAGVRRLQATWASGEPGALLCDDMGLGKTLQALVFAAWAARELRQDARSDRDRREGPVDVPVAVVAPPSLLDGWVREMAQRLAPDVLPSLLWGQSAPPAASGGRAVVPLAQFLRDAKGKGTVLDHARVDLDALRAAAPDVLLIGYDTLRRLQFAVGQIRFGVLIADEAQEAKDPSSLRSVALRAMHYDFGLALTGTPIENGWRDLWTLCDFAVPGRLGTAKDFARDYPSTGEVRATGTRLAEALGPVLLRRTREVALAALPPCTFRADRRVMPPDQALAYRAEVSRHHLAGTDVLGLLQQLARVSLHARMGAPLATAADADRWARESARTAALWDALARWREEGAAVLVFVRSKTMQDTLRRALALAFRLPHVGVLNGDLGMRDRQPLVDRVANESGFRVLLVSPDVGGAGWNLQFATRAVLLERPYNPAVEAQMVARIHRMGQDRPVEVLAPLALLEGVRTYDEVLDGLLTEKRSLSESVLAPSVTSSEELAARFQSLGEPVPAAVEREPAPPRTPEAPARPPDWLAAVADEGHRRVLTHLGLYGAATEEEVAAMLGGASQARRFARSLEALLAGAPMSVRIYLADGVKRYVRER